MNKFTVTLNHHGNYGYIEYDSDSKKAKVVLNDADAKARVEKFLSETLTLDVQEGETVRQFVTKTLNPLENLANFKQCITRLWFNTDVLVEWSMPPNSIENL